jgi:hypothetical protein
MRITTAATSHENGTERDLSAAFQELQAQDDDFLRIERRGSDDSLQTLRLPIELVRGGRVFRAATVPAVEALFRAFAAGTAGWDQGIEWVDVTDRIRRERRDPWIFIAVVAGAMAVAFVVGWLLIRRVWLS